MVSAHTSLCTWPIYAFGTEEQQQKYLPDLCSGEKLGAFEMCIRDSIRLENIVSGIHKSVARRVARCV